MGLLSSLPVRIVWLVIAHVLAYCAAVVAGCTSSLPSVSDAIRDIFSDTAIAELPSSAIPSCVWFTLIDSCVIFKNLHTLNL